MRSSVVHCNAPYILLEVNKRRGKGVALQGGEKDVTGELAISRGEVERSKRKEPKVHRKQVGPSYLSQVTFFPPRKDS